MTEPRKLRVFLCHASQDKPIVRELYQRLLAEGWIDPWLDEEKLLPGQDWDMEIEKAVEAADVVVACLSSASVTKEGYVQREIRLALSVELEKPEETIFIIPLRLDECVLPRSIRTIQYINYFPDEYKGTSVERLLASLQIRAKSLGIQIEEFAKKTSDRNADSGGRKFQSDFSIIQEFKIRSSDFFVKPLPMRRAAANEIRKLAKELQINDVLHFAGSPISGERVASAIALGEKVKDNPTYGELPEIKNALQSLLLDRESRVRFRALESIGYSRILIEYFRKRIEESVYDENKSIKELSEVLLKR